MHRIKELKPFEFKAEHDILVPVPRRPIQQKSQEKVLTSQDKRQFRALNPKVSQSNPFWYWHQIGLLRLVFEVEDKKEKVFFGTATVFCVDNKKGCCYALTCAHNLLHYDQFTDNKFYLKKAWFERRLSKWSLFSGYTSESFKRYCIVYYDFHEKYDPRAVSPSTYDIGIIAFYDPDKFYHDNCHRFGRLPYAKKIAGCGKNGIKNLYIAGFPDDKDQLGQLWESTCPEYKSYLKKDKNGDRIDTLAHEMDTHNGQSGSAIVELTLPFTGLKNKDNTMADTVDVEIIGVHTDGGYGENYGVYLSDDLKNWIKEAIGAVSRTITQTMSTQFDLKPIADRLSGDGTGCKDSRSIRILSKNDFCYWHQIGMMVTEDDSGNHHRSTATVVFADQETEMCCAVVKAKHLTKRKLKQVFFQHRISKWGLFRHSSEFIAEYKVEKWVVHSRFDPKKPDSPYNIGIIFFGDSDQFYSNNSDKFWKLSHEPWMKHGKFLYIGGFTKKQLWETAAPQTYDSTMCNNDAKFVKYNMDTAGGMKGAIVVQVKCYKHIINGYENEQITIDPSDNQSNFEHGIRTSMATIATRTNITSNNENLLKIDARVAMVGIHIRRGVALRFNKELEKWLMEQINVNIPNLNKHNIRLPIKEKYCKNCCLNFIHLIDWSIERIIWIGFLKSSDNINKKCWFASINKDEIIKIIDYIGTKGYKKRICSNQRKTK